MNIYQFEPKLAPPVMPRRAHRQTVALRAQSAPRFAASAGARSCRSALYAQGQGEPPFSDWERERRGSPGSCGGSPGKPCRGTRSGSSGRCRPSPRRAKHDTLPTLGLEDQTSEYSYNNHFHTDHCTTPRHSRACRGIPMHWGSSFQQGAPRYHCCHHTTLYQIDCLHNRRSFPPCMHTPIEPPSEGLP